MVKDQRDTRRDYGATGLRRAALQGDPLDQFERWFTEAVDAGLADATAMALATAGADGQPAVRIVLLKHFDEDGFCWYTDYRSAKGRELAENPRAAPDVRREAERALEGLRSHAPGRIGRYLERGLGERTLLVVTADHGEEFFEHGRFGHRKTLYDESIAVPLVLRWPGTLPAGTRVETLASLTDLAPTILAATGTAGLPDVAGRSLLSGLSGDAPLGSTWVLSELARKDRSMMALRTDRWKLLFRGHNGRPVELYDLESDPGERRNRLDDAPELRAEAEAALARALAVLEELAERHDGRGDAGGSDLPPDVEQRLRELGYLGGGDG